MFTNSNGNYHFTNKYWNDMAFNVINQHFIQLTPLFTIQLLIKQNVCCTKVLIAGENDSI